MSGSPQRYAQVAVPTPLRGTFDYLVPPNLDHIGPGMRVRVPFGRTNKVGIVVAISHKSAVPADKLKTITACLDATPLLNDVALSLAKWASDYYHHPIGDVLHASLPKSLRVGKPAQLPTSVVWCINAQGSQVDLDSFGRAHRQRSLLEHLRQCEAGASEEMIVTWQISGWRQVMAKLVSAGYVDRAANLQESPIPRAVKRHCLTPEQAAAVESIASAKDSFAVFLLQGITGSGKTEVYLETIRRVVAGGQQVLVLVPEIGLTPQTLSRFEAGLPCTLGVFHSGLTDTQRFSVWMRARDGQLPVIIGTRSAIWIPLCNPGLFIVDEEHDLSYKQHEGFRYSARDLAIIRASRANTTAVLGTATPSFETLHNTDQGRNKSLVLSRRVAGASLPKTKVIDVRGRPFNDGLSIELLHELSENLSDGEQSLLFLNRRGYAPSLMCHDCGWVGECQRCDANMVYHQEVGSIRCHHCGAERPKPTVCPDCASDVFERGAGTQRIAQALEKHFPTARIARIDRDSTRRKGALNEVLDQIQRRAIDIVVGTQMLAKGHHFPHVTLVSILDADSGLYGVDFRAAERMAQLLVQVAGRAGRGERPGRVLIQTHHPDHPLLETLLHGGYANFAKSAMIERREAGLPPYTNLALLRAEAGKLAPVEDFLAMAKRAAVSLKPEPVELFGPVPAPMERRAGRYRAQLLVQSASRSDLHRFLNPWLLAIESKKTNRRVRWSLDIDPQDMI